MKDGQRSMRIEDARTSEIVLLSDPSSGTTLRYVNLPMISWSHAEKVDRAHIKI
jgi:hypothetical protein